MYEESIYVMTWLTVIQLNTWITTFNHYYKKQRYHMKKKEKEKKKKKKEQQNKISMRTK